MPESKVKLETLLRAARDEYGRDEADDDATYPYSPARATTALAKKYGTRAPARSRLVPLVAEVYYEENGRRSPLVVPARKTDAARKTALAKAVLKRREEGGRLGRWDVIAYSASETLGRPVSVATIRALFRLAGGDETRSYTGRGTRRGAFETRYDETAEIEGSV